MYDVKIGDLTFRNPVVTASGTFGMGDEFKDFMDYSKIGGITMKTVTRNPRKGNPPPRIYECSAGLLNSIGLANEGFDKLLSDLKKNDYLKEIPTNVIFSLAGDKVSDFPDMVARLSDFSGIAMFELNLSCPNVEENGVTFDSRPGVLEKVVKCVSKALEKTLKPFSVKISPMQNVVQNSKIAEENGCHALTISNTYLGTAIDSRTGSFIFANRVAGFSGPAVKPLALYHVMSAASAVKIPVIASGGICSLTDAKEFMLAGAKFVSIGTMNFIEPGISAEIAEGLEGWIKPIMS
ncbi:MAG: dihydroorotate dehydrogenase [Brevinematales bacterium]|jgi:dihydroorotate dehydrogenase (NAD+) catalytic subunit